MINAGHLDLPWQEQQAILRYPLPTIGIAAIMVGLATAGLASSLPAFSPVFNTPLFSFFSEINQMVGLIVSLYAAYRWHPTVGMDGILLFFVANVPYIYMNFPGNLPELMNLAFVALVALMGIWLIAELRRAVELAQQREQELKGVAVLNTKVLNQRIQFLEDSDQKSEQIDCLQRAISIAGGGNTPLEVAREFLHLVHEETMAEYVSFTLVDPDGALGERVDSFRGMTPFVPIAHDGGLAQEVVASRAAQYITDTGTDPMANPSLAAAGILSYLGVPVNNEERLAGVLFMHSTRSHAFQKDTKDMEFLESISRLLAGTLLRAELHAQVEAAKVG